MTADHQPDEARIETEHAADIDPAVPLYDGSASDFVCPECGEPAQDAAPTAVMPNVGAAVEWSHLDGEPLCPVMTAEGYRPAVAVPASWFTSQATHSAPIEPEAGQGEEARIDAEYAADVERAVQRATDAEVRYGPSGDVELTRDPYEILTRHADAPATGNAARVAAVEAALDEGVEMAPAVAMQRFPQVLDIVEWEAGL